MIRLTSKLASCPILRFPPGWPRAAETARAQVLSSRLPERPGEYDAWIRAFDTLRASDRKAIRDHIDGFALKPTISLLLPADDERGAHLDGTVASVRRQLYPHWELCAAPVSGLSRSRLRRVLDGSGSMEPRIKFTPPLPFGEPALHLNAILGMATGSYAAVIEPGDALSEHALYCIALEINRHPEAAILYSDHDQIDARGRRHDPHFKPDWDPDFARSHNYPSHPTVYKTRLVRALGGFRARGGRGEGHDLMLRCAASLATERVRHIPALLYHARAPSLETPPARLAAGADMTTRRARPSAPNPAPRVSILIPTRDGGRRLERCIQSILGRTAYPEYEILVLNNRSKDPGTLDYLRLLAADVPIRVLDYDAPFNYAAINNYAVRHATGEIVALVNDDVEVIGRDWLLEMVSHAARPEIGAVGAKLYFPDGSLQHGGIVVGLGGLARHRHKGVARHAPGYLGGLTAVQSVSAVTGACLVVRKALYEEVGGLDAENLPIAFNDVDFCLRLAEAGYRNLWTPLAELYHVESATRGHDGTPARRRRLAREARYFKSRWRDRLENDPAYNPNLSLSGDGFALAWPPRTERPWAAGSKAETRGIPDATGRSGRLWRTISNHLSRSSNGHR